MVTTLETTLNKGEVLDFPSESYLTAPSYSQEDVDEKILNMYYSKKGFKKDYSENDIVDKINREYGEDTVNLRKVSDTVRGKKSGLERDKSKTGEVIGEGKDYLKAEYEEARKAGMNKRDAIRKTAQNFRKESGYNVSQKDVREAVDDYINGPEEFVQERSSEINSSTEIANLESVPELGQEGNYGVENSSESNEIVSRNPSGPLRRTTGSKDFFANTVNRRLLDEPEPIKIRPFEDESEEEDAPKIRIVKISSDNLPEVEEKEHEREQFKFRDAHIKGGAYNIAKIEQEVYDDFGDNTIEELTRRVNFKVNELARQSIFLEDVNEDGIRQILNNGPARFGDPNLFKECREDDKELTEEKAQEYYFNRGDFHVDRLESKIAEKANRGEEMHLTISSANKDIEDLHKQGIEFENQIGENEYTQIVLNYFEEDPSETRYEDSDTIKMGSNGEAIGLPKEIPREAQSKVEGYVPPKTLMSKVVDKKFHPRENPELETGTFDLREHDAFRVRKTKTEQTAERIEEGMDKFKSGIHNLRRKVDSVKDTALATSLLGFLSYLFK